MFFSFQVQLVQKSSLAQPCKARGCEDPGVTGDSDTVGSRGGPLASLLWGHLPPITQLSRQDTSPAGCAASISVEVSAALPKLQEEASPPVALRKSGFTPLSTKPALFQEPLSPGSRIYEVRKAHTACPESCSALSTGDLWGQTPPSRGTARIPQTRPRAMAQHSSGRFNYNN